MSGDLQAQGIGRGDLDILYMFRTFCKGFKIILDVVQVEKQRKSLVWNRYLLWHASCKRVIPRTSTLWIVMPLILRTSHDLQMATSHKAYPETRVSPKRWRNQNNSNTNECSSKLWPRLLNRNPYRQSECVLSGGKKRHNYSLPFRLYTSHLYYNVTNWTTGTASSETLSSPIRLEPVQSYPTLLQQLTGGQMIKWRT